MRGGSDTVDLKRVIPLGGGDEAEDRKMAVHIEAGQSKPQQRGWR